MFSILLRIDVKRLFPGVLFCVSNENKINILSHVRKRELAACSTIHANENVAIPKIIQILKKKNLVRIQSLADSGKVCLKWEA